MDIQYRRSKDKREKIAKDYNAGMPIKELMKKYGKSRPGIYWILAQEKKQSTK